MTLPYGAVGWSAVCDCGIGFVYFVMRDTLCCLCLTIINMMFF